MSSSRPWISISPGTVTFGFDSPSKEPEPEEAEIDQAIHRLPSATESIKPTNKIKTNSADDLIGFALLPVAPLLASSSADSGPHSFDLPLQKNGLAKGRGRVKGKVRVEWPGEGEVFREVRRKRLPKAAQLVRECCVVS